MNLDLNQMKLTTSQTLSMQFFCFWSAKSSYHCCTNETAKLFSLSAATRSIVLSGMWCMNCVPKVSTAEGDLTMFTDTHTEMTFRMGLGDRFSLLQDKYTHMLR